MKCQFRIFVYTLDVDKLFYRELSQELINLEELIMNERNKGYVSACDQDIFLQDIDKHPFAVAFTILAQIFIPAQDLLPLFLPAHRLVDI